jgi:prepilin-type N-terminal cleavage/methylation domain-containing protein
MGRERVPNGALNPADGWHMACRMGSQENCMRFKHSKLGNAGYTLIEMMVVVGVIGLLAAITVPNFSGYLKRQREVGSRNQLMSDLYYARSLAIAKRRTMQVTFTDSQYQVLDTVDGTVERTTTAPPGITFAASGNPNFYAWGLADAADITLTGAGVGSVVSLLPSGSVEHAQY